MYIYIYICLGIIGTLNITYMKDVIAVTVYRGFGTLL